jgi:hypothetical protein
MSEATPVVSASTFTATVNGVPRTAPTQDELVSLVLQLQPVVAPVSATASASKQATQPEKTLTARVAGRARTLVDATANNVLIPIEIYGRDKLVPNALCGTAVIAAKASIGVQRVGSWLQTLAAASLAKSIAMRPLA